MEEQSYKVPENWCWTILGSLVDTSKEKTEDFSDPDVKYVGLEHLEKDTGIIGSASAEGVKSLKKFIYYMMSFLQKALEDNAPATAQKNINLKILNAVEISIPTVEEQAEIVCILDSLFAKEQQAKEAAETVLEQIDLLKKFILARAFRGELGTNDPTEESAGELLKNIL